MDPRRPPWIGHDGRSLLPDGDAPRQELVYNAPMASEVLIIRTDEDMASGMSRKAAIRSRMRALEAELAVIDQFGDDTYDDGDVLMFSIVFAANTVAELRRRSASEAPVEYTYAALKQGGTWYLTGSVHGQHKTWDQLVDFWTNGGEVQRIIKLKTDAEKVVFDRDAKVIEAE